jgi:polyisoprenoid-binding protein YceI
MKKETFLVDTENTQAIWTGKRLTGFHQGSIQISHGALEIVDGVLDTGGFTFAIQTIQVLDIKDATLNRQLHDHLLSEDFFAADKFPYAHFEIISALPDGEGNYNIDGDLTIKGITSPLNFDAVINVNSSVLTATAKIIVDRTKYDIKFRSDKFFENLGDFIIYDDFVLDLELYAKISNVLETEDLDLSNII